MLQLILRYGLVAGVIVAAPMLYRMLTATETEAHLGGMLVGYLTMLVALTAVFLGVKQYRDRFKVIVGGSGFFFPVGDRTALAAHLRQLLAAPHRFRISADVARSRFAEALSMDRMVDHTERVLWQACARRGPRPGAA